MSEKLGPTGTYPQGKLNEDDEGALNIAVSSEKGCVRVDFGKHLDWLALPPDEALAFASAIAKRATALKMWAKAQEQEQEQEPMQ